LRERRLRWDKRPHEETTRSSSSPPVIHAGAPSVKSAMGHANTLVNVNPSGALSEHAQGRSRFRIFSESSVASQPADIGSAFSAGMRLRSLG
jgi:hypothetical protein